MKKESQNIVQPTELDDDEMEKVTGGAMVVNHNMAEINTLTQLSKNQSSLSKSLEKLSSGMKIDSAADDPSGYQISERMRVQNQALDQANYNVQNGRSMLKVAEGAVSSTVEILRTLKEKVIDAVNDTNTEVDRDAIQKEIDASIQQIDDNALLTFDGKFLNNGARTCKGEAISNVLYNEQLNEDTKTDTTLTSLKDRCGKNLEIEATDNITVSYVQGGKTYTSTFEVNESTTLNDLFFKPIPESETDSDIVKRTPDDDNALPFALSEGTNDNGNALFITADVAGIDGQISAICIEVKDKNGNIKADANSILDSFTEAVSARNESDDNGVAIQIGPDSKVKNLSLDGMRASALGLSGKGATVSVADKTAATATLKVIDNALQRALNQEASIGAAMNRLEFTSNNLTTSSENLQSAESTYRDADMAKEMTEFTKNNILMQAAQSMLSQANQQNQGVLSLLQ